MVSFRLKQIILLALIIASPYSYAELPNYEGTTYDVSCGRNDNKYNEVEKKVSALGNITENYTRKLLSPDHALKRDIGSTTNMLTTPFPQEIVRRVSKDSMYSNSANDIKIACVDIFEIDYHKVAYHLFYINTRDKNIYQDIGTVIIADNKKKADFLLCQEAGENFIKKDEKKGINRLSYKVGIGIPFGFNNITSYNRDNLNGIPSNASQCQIKALPRENSDHEYILFYAWETTEEGGLFSKNKHIINWRVIDRK